MVCFSCSPSDFSFFLPKMLGVSRGFFISSEGFFTAEAFSGGGSATTGVSDGSLLASSLGASCAGSLFS